MFFHFNFSKKPLTFNEPFFDTNERRKHMQNQTGRSMVEMLGVLAIIGVLSIGGIAGYTIAMKRYRANEIINTAAKLAVISLTKQNGYGVALENEFDFNNVFGISMDASQGYVYLRGLTLNDYADTIRSIAGDRFIHNSALNFTDY